MSQPYHRSIRNLFWWALVLRIAAAAVITIGGWQDTFSSDGTTYDNAGMCILNQWRYGTPLPEWASRVTGSHPGYVYFVGAVYFLTGRHPFLLQLFSALFGALTVVVIFKLAAFLFDTRVALRAASFVAFFPSMIIWSSQILRDPLIMLFTTLCLYIALRLNKAFQVGNLVLLLLYLFIVYTLRFYVAWVLLACLGVSYLLGSRSLAKGIAKQVVIAAILAGFVIYSGIRASSQEYLERGLAGLEYTRSALTDAGSGFGFGENVSTPVGAALALPVGLIYFMLAPFPWQVTSMRSASVLPEMLVWWWLIPTTLRGFREALRVRGRECVFVINFVVGLTLFYALVEGNIGSLFRHRAQVFIFLFIFTAVGLELRKRRLTADQ